MDLMVKKISKTLQTNIKSSMGIINYMYFQIDSVCQIGKYGGAGLFGSQEKEMYE